jgi:hypothetical protein
MDGADGTSGIIVAMEIVFTSSLLEAAKDLKDDEILFCPLGRWSEAIRWGVGGFVVDKEELKDLTNSDFDLFIGLFKIFDYNKLRLDKMDRLFFYVFNPGLIVSSWKEILEEVRKNDRYLGKEILRDAELIEYVGSYNLFLFKSFETRNDKEREFIKSIVAGRVSEKLVNKEIDKRGYYSRDVKKVIGADSLLRELRLSVVIPAHVIEERGVEGARDYIRDSDIYHESVVDGNRTLTIFSPNRRYEGAKVETDLVVKYDKDKVYIVFGRVYEENVGKDYLLGVPLFKGKIQKIKSVFGSVSLDPSYKYNHTWIRKREKPKSSKGKLLAELRTEAFEVNSIYARKHRIIEEKKGRRVIEVNDNDTRILQVKGLGREEHGKTKYNEYKLCDIEVDKDGRFSVKTDYNNVIEVLVTPTKGDGKEAEELKELLGRLLVISGRILEEVSNQKEKKRKIVLEESKSPDEVEKYIAYSFYEFVKRIVRSKVEGGFPLKLSKKREEEKRLIDLIQSGFVQNKVSRNLETLRKLVDLCFESGGRKHLIKTHNMGDLEKIAYEKVMRSAGIDREGLKGEEKSIVEVLKLISHSYPLMDRPNIERVLEELRGLTNIVFSREKVPLDEIGVLIHRVNPEYTKLPYGHIVMIPSSSALFLVEGDEIKVYTKDHTYENPMLPRNVKRVSMGLGNLEITIFG